MRKILLLAVLLLSNYGAWANVAASGWCEVGAQAVVTSGLQSSGTFQASYPQCLVTVYPTGSGTPVPSNQIFSNNGSTVLGNPFTANTNGWWEFYAANGRYDVVLSLVPPVTISDVSLFDPATGSVATATTATTATHALNLPADLATQSAASPAPGTFTIINGVCDAGAQGYSDVGAGVNACIATLPTYTTLNGPTPVGRVIIPKSYSYSTTINMGPLVTVDCQNNAITYTGSGWAALSNDSPTSYSGWGGFENCPIFGTSSAAGGVEVQESTFFHFWNSRVAGFTNGPGLYFHDAVKWTEQANLNRVLLDNNAYCMKFQDDSSGALSGFSYHTWLDVNCSTLYAGGGTGVEVVNSWLSSKPAGLNINYFLSQGSTAFKVDAPAVITSGTHISHAGELTGGATSANGVVVASGGDYEPNESRWWGTPGITDSGVINSFVLRNYNEAWIRGVNGINGVDFILPGATLNNFARIDLNSLNGVGGRYFYFPTWSGCTSGSPCPFAVTNQSQQWSSSQNFGPDTTWDAGQMTVPGDFRCAGVASGTPSCFISAHDSSGGNSIGLVLRTQNAGSYATALTLNPTGTVTVNSESGAATYLACYTTGGTLGHCATAPSGTPPTCGCTQ